MDLPLTALFVDCDSYFASVEQHLDPRLRGRPVGVAPVLAESSCCIAASYEAKACGVKTGTGIREARQLCPGIAIVESKPSEYIRYHHRIIEAVESCIHVEAVLSIDEMWAWLPYNRRQPDQILETARRIKATIARDISPVIRVSIGAAPNRYLAKTASKMRKPDGLLLLHSHDLPHALHELSLRDLNGISRNMEARLHAVGIHHVHELCSAPKELLHKAWNGVLGDRLWHLLRGEEIPDPPTSRRSLGHSHVLPPECRPPDKAWPVACKLLHKACERLRHLGLLTGTLHLRLAYLRGPSWDTAQTLPETDSTLQLMRLLGRLWRTRPDPKHPLLQVAITLTHLVEHHNFTPLLLPPAERDEEHRQRRLDSTLDQLRHRFGRKAVFFGSIHDARDHAPMRISFTHIPDQALEGDSPPRP